MLPFLAKRCFDKNFVKQNVLFFFLHMRFPPSRCVFLTFIKPYYLRLITLYEDTAAYNIPRSVPLTSLDVCIRGTATVLFIVFMKRELQRKRVLTEDWNYFFSHHATLNKLDVVRLGTKRLFSCEQFMMIRTAVAGYDMFRIFLTTMKLSYALSRPRVIAHLWKLAVR